MANLSPSNSGATVTLGCKLPHGLYLDLYAEKHLPGADPVLQARVKVNGTNSSEIIGGHGVTLGVSKEHWEEWKRRNHQNVALAKGFIFAHDKAETAVAMAKERKDVRTGFEGLDGNNPAKAVGVSAKALERADEMAKA